MRSSGALGAFRILQRFLGDPVVQVHRPCVEPLVFRALVYHRLDFPGGIKDVVEKLGIPVIQGLALFDS